MKGKLDDIWVNVLDCGLGFTLMLFTLSYPRVITG